MSINVKGFLKDVGGASRVTKLRELALANASSVPQPKDPIRELSDKLHPLQMQFRVTEIRDATPTAKTFRFEKPAKMKAKNGISSTFLTIKLCATVVQMHALKHDGKRHRLRANGH